MYKRQVLDRNGLRPSRYVVTKDDLVVMASEVGVLPIEPERILHKGLLEPRKKNIDSLEEGRIIDDSELKLSLAGNQPYKKWNETHLHPIESLPIADSRAAFEGEELLQLQRAFGYTVEDLKYILSPMMARGEESIGSMGTDTPLAVLSDEHQLLYNYFQQLFAQVTNPPLDAIREEIVTASDTVLGPEGNLLDQSLPDIDLVKLKTPFLNNSELAQIIALENDDRFGSTVIPIHFDANGGDTALSAGLDELFSAADEAVSYTHLTLPTNREV